MLWFEKGGVRHCRAAVMEERLMHRDATLDRQEWIESLLEGDVTFLD